MNLETMLFRHSARRDAYKGLSECYYPPDYEILFRLKGLEENLGELKSKALIHVARMRSEIQGAENVEKLEIDFSRLFVGPYSLLAPPYGSVYLEGARKIMGDSTMDIIKRYGDAGLMLAENFKDAPDHIAAELEFMYFLVFREIEAIRAESDEDISDLLCKQSSFLQKHLGLWVSTLAQNIEANAETDFYRHLAMATRIFIVEDMDEIKKLKICEPISPVC